MMFQEITLLTLFHQMSTLIGGQGIRHVNIQETNDRGKPVLRQERKASDTKRLAYLTEAGPDKSGPAALRVNQIGASFDM